MDVIHKIGAIILNDKKILVGKKGSKFIIPGGRIENSEDHRECLKRELREINGCFQTFSRIIMWNRVRNFFLSTITDLPAEEINEGV